jgi:hypothetical protein
MPPFQPKRELWVTKKLAEKLKARPLKIESCGASEDELDEARRLLNAFTVDFLIGQGPMIVASEKGRRCQIRCITPEGRGDKYLAWELRPTMDDPQVRVFGVFAAANHFIAERACLKRCVDQGNARRSTYTRGYGAVGALLPILKESGVLSWRYRPSAADLNVLGGNYVDAS